MISLLLMLFSFQGAFAQGHIVGNGGDGFKVNGSVYVRDLMEVGLEKSEIEHAVPKVRMALAAEAVKNVVPISASKLAILLTRFEMVVPGMGEYLAYAIRMHSWSFVSAKLLPVSDDCNIISVPGGEFVQIANRMNGTIRIDSEAWNAMNDENRIALVIHEAVYSLVMPAQKKPGVCFYPGMKTREITGVLFDPEFINRGGSAYKNIIAPEMDWPRDISAETRSDAGIFALDLLKKTPSGLQAIENSHLIVQSPFKSLITATRIMCLKFTKGQPGDQRDYILKGRLGLRRFEGNFSKYDAGFGEQFHLQITNRSGSLNQELELTLPMDFVDCQNALRPLLSRAPTEI